MEPEVWFYTKSRFMSWITLSQGENSLQTGQEGQTTDLGKSMVFILDGCSFHVAHVC